jgi:hypothetical protein
MHSTVHAWHALIAERNIKNIPTILSEDIVMHSPVVHTPIVGKKMVTLYLTGAFHTFLTPDFKYIRELSSDSTAILEFTTVVDGIIVNGVDMISWDETGKITDFKVMVRPLKAMNIIHQKMGLMLEKLKAASY